MFYVYIEEYSTEPMPSGYEADVVSIRECYEYRNLDDAMENFMNMVKSAEQLGYDKTFCREHHVHRSEEIFPTHTLVKRTNMYPMVSYGNKICLEDKFSIRMSEEKPHDMVYHWYADYEY